MIKLELSEWAKNKKVGNDTKNNKTNEIFSNISISSYPNPFNPITSIQYRLSEDTAVTITIYDIMGRLITTLANNEHKVAGSYMAEWDGMDKNGNVVASGIYFCRLVTGGHALTQKLTLVR